MSIQTVLGSEACTPNRDTQFCRTSDLLCSTISGVLQSQSAVTWSYYTLFDFKTLYPKIYKVGRTITVLSNTAVKTV